MRKPNCTITHAELVHALDYDSSTGFFRWKNPPVRCPVKGKIAGRIDSGGYRQIAINKLRYGAHRLAWFYHYAKWPKGQLDHINLNKDDNRIENLRECSPANNSWNRRVRSDSKTGLKGVVHSYKGNYCAYITKNGHDVYLGYFPTAEEAHAAYVEASQRLHGEFGRVS